MVFPQRSKTRSTLGQFLFSFVVMADTHLNQTEAESSSPYPSNKLTNARARYVIHQINQLSPEFVIHLGDLTNPVPSLSTYEPAVANFKALFNNLESKLYVIPGNHDVGDKPVTWMPAGRVNNDYIAQYEKHFGPHFYAFEANNCRFIMLNAQILNSGLDCEQTQKSWLERELAVNADRRTFMCIHYPPYTTSPLERSSYDNIDEPARSWLLELVEMYKPEALFAAHVHNFFYNRHADTECYVLPSISFVRHDYSELFRIGPGPENGRNDTAKLGYFVIKVYEKGHVARLIRTNGKTLAPGKSLDHAVQSVIPRHTKENDFAPVGVDLRHAWAEVSPITASGGADEFERKLARNDYPILAVWEMGLRKLRVPVQDLANPDTRSRMRTLARLGHEFTVYTYGVPQGAMREALIEHHNLVSGWEVVVFWPEVDAIMAAIREVRQAAPLKVFLSKLRTKEDARRDGKHYYHNINHGFVLAETEAIDTFLHQKETTEIIDGLVFRLPREMSSWVVIPQVSCWVEERGLEATVYVRTVSENPAEDFVDDLANANRIAEVMVTALAVKTVNVFIDCFADIDRGYFVRAGLVDRRYNPRLAGKVVQNLYGALNTENASISAGKVIPITGGQLFTLYRASETLILVLPQSDLTLSEIAVEHEQIGGFSTAKWINLETGIITPINWQKNESSIWLTKPMTCREPALLILG